MKLWDIATVDLGAAHNGRVVQRNIWVKADGTLVIIDKGKHVPVRCINPDPAYSKHGFTVSSGTADIAYVTV